MDGLKLSDRLVLLFNEQQAQKPLKALKSPKNKKGKRDTKGKERKGCHWLAGLFYESIETGRLPVRSHLVEYVLAWSVASRIIQLNFKWVKLKNKPEKVREC